MEGISPLNIGGVAARALDVGLGTPIVVLHGWGGRIESMTPVVRCLQKQFQVVAVDLPGFGESEDPPGTWGSPEYARFVKALLDSKGIERAHFVGHSFGAKIALQIAAEWPEAVDRLVLVGSSGLRSAPSLRVRGKRLVSKGARAAGHFGAPGARLREALFTRIASKDYLEAGTLRSILVKVVNEDLTDILPAVEAPTLLVWGSKDDATPLDHGRKMEQLIPDAGLVVFEGAGHFAYLDEPERFCRILRHFFGAPAE